MSLFFSFIADINGYFAIPTPRLFRPENSYDVLASDRGPSCSRIEQLKGKTFYLIRFLEDIKSHREEGECHKRSSTLCKTPLKSV